MGNLPQRVVVAGWHVVAVLGLIRGAIFLEDVGQFQHLGPPMNGLEILHQIINHGARARLRLGGEVGVAGCGLGRRMPQIRLNDAQTHSGFQQVGDVGMAQAVDRDAFGDARLLLGEATGFLERTDRNRRRGWLTLRPAGPAGRKQPDRMAMREPIVAQEFQRALWEGHIPVFVPLAAADMHEHPAAVDVRDLKLGAFGQPETTRVDRGQAQARVRQAHGLEQALHLVVGQHIGQGLRFRGANHVQDAPVPAQRLRVKGLDSAQGLFHGRKRPVSGVLHVQKILPDLLVRELIRRSVKMFGQHPHGADVGLLCSVGLPLQLQVFEKTLSESGHTRASMMNEVYTQDEYIMEQDDTFSDHDKKKMGGRSAKLFCRPAALFNIS